ncbi:MAG TPA: hypothetical protein VFK86_14315 [Bauldia sp.]|nr:hypothetical protein [Bauldia sp.]
MGGLIAGRLFDHLRRLIPAGLRRRFARSAWAGFLGLLLVGMAFPVGFGPLANHEGFKRRGKRIRQVSGLPGFALVVGLVVRLAGATGPTA